MIGCAETKGCRTAGWRGAVTAGSFGKTRQDKTRLCSKLKDGADPGMACSRIGSMWDLVVTVTSCDTTRRSPSLPHKAQA